MNDTTRTGRLRELLRGPDLLAAPGCFNALSALLVEQAGFPAVYLSGAALASNFLGYPDIGLVSMAEVLQNARNVAQATSLPVICDVDTGFGNALNVQRTVREFEQAGIAGLQLEDQVMPKKCGHTEGKRLVPAAEMVQKIRAAVEARRDPDLVLIARTDAIAVTGVEDALGRARSYREAGADVLFVEAPRTLEEMRRITREAPGPHLVNVVEGGGKTPVLRAAEYQALGYRLAIYPISCWTAAIKGMQDVLAALRGDGVTSRCADRMVSFQEMFEIVGRSRFAELERRYSAP
jgi:carboxyvinyl-carboxyphosphonate phosphorylmutase